MESFSYELQQSHRQSTSLRLDEEKGNKVSFWLNKWAYANSHWKNKLGLSMLLLAVDTSYLLTMIFQNHHQSAYATNLVMFPLCIPSQIANQKPSQIHQMAVVRTGKWRSVTSQQFYRNILWMEEKVFIYFVRNMSCLYLFFKNFE